MLIIGRQLKKPTEKKRIVSFLNRNQTHISNVLTTISNILALPTIITIFVYFSNHILYSKLLDKVFGPSIVLGTAIFFSSGFFLLLVGFFWLLYAYKNITSKSRVKDALLNAYQRPEQYFRSWAQNNTDTDKMLFDLLFFAPYSKNTKIIEFSRIKDLIERNIEKTIDVASLILSAFTGSECKASFQALKSNEAVRDHSDFYLLGRQHWCDERSRDDRDVEYQKIYLNENPFFKYVLFDKGKLVAIDDLSSLPDYTTLDEKWRSQRNAILLRSVANLAPVENVPPYTGILLIEHMDGGLTHPTCIHYIKEFCHRLAIMHYRLLMVSELLDEHNRGLLHAG